MASVRIENLHKAFADVEALKGISFDIKDGEFFCLLGPPGAGKTTTLRVIAGLEKPDEGHVWLGNILVDAVHPKDRDVAMVFEDMALYPHWTAFDNLAHPLKMQKLSRVEIERQVNSVAEILHISHLLDRRPGTFSGGERRRVAIGRALVRQPRVLLLDQPLTDLDAKIRQEMTGELKRLQTDTHQTMIYATHDYEEAVSMADRIMVVNLGLEEQTGSPEHIYTLPDTAFVASFVGSPAMNFIPCKVSSNDHGTFAEHPCFRLQILGAHDFTSLNKVTLGIRPEHIHTLDIPSPEAIIARVEIVQVLGDEQIVDLNLDDGTAIKLVTSLTMDLALGDEIPILFIPEHILWFDTITGQRV